jgi:hypothetical protein
MKVKSRNQANGFLFSVSTELTVLRDWYSIVIKITDRMTWQLKWTIFFISVDFHCHIIKLYNSHITKGGGFKFCPLFFYFFSFAPQFFFFNLALQIANADSAHTYNILLNSIILINKSLSCANLYCHINKVK